MKKKKVFLDTNFLLIPGQFKVDVFSEIERVMEEPFELCVLEGTLRELKKLAEGGSRDAQAAKLGYVLAKQKGLKTMRGSKNHVDDALVEITDKDTFVCTQDKELKGRVREKGGKTITMRKKQYLELEG